MASLRKQAVFTPTAMGAAIALAMVLLPAMGPSPSKSLAATPDSAARDDDAPVEQSPSTFDGYTLVAPLYHMTTYLVDMEGNIVHYWQHDSTPAGSAYLLENGNLLRTGTLDDPPPSPAGGAGRGGMPGGMGFGGGGMPGGFGMPGGAEAPVSKGGAAGGRVQEIAWDGEIVWEFQYSSRAHILHHDIQPMPNGNILMLAWEQKTAQEAIAAGRNARSQGNTELHPDFVMEVKPTGDGGAEIVWEWHIWDHLIQDQDPSKANYGDVAAHPELIDINYSDGMGTATTGGMGGMPGMGGAPGGFGFPGGGAMGFATPDWTHTNAVAYNAELDQIVVSVYGFSEIWIIDHSTTTEEAAGHTGGRCGKGGDLLYRWGNPEAYRAGTDRDQRFFHQHDAHWIPEGYPGEGHLLVFNNGAGRQGEEYSSVDELVLPVDEDGKYILEPGTAYGPEEPVWSYSAPKKTEFYAMHISGATRQPNGNTLICSGAYGVIFEVTPQMEVLWRCAYTGAGGPDGSDARSMMGGFGGGMSFGAPGGGMSFGVPGGGMSFGVPGGGMSFGGGPGGFGMPGGAPGGFGMPGGLSMPGSPTREETSQGSRHFVISREDPNVSGTRGMPRSLPVWGGGTGFGILENQVFRVYRYAPDYPGLAGKGLTPLDTAQWPQ